MTSGPWTAASVRRLCRACPVLAQEGREPSPPQAACDRGPRFDPHLKALKGALYMCTTCGRCEEVCPSRLPRPPRSCG